MESEGSASAVPLPWDLVSKEIGLQSHNSCLNYVIMTENIKEERIVQSILLSSILSTHNQNSTTNLLIFYSLVQKMGWSFGDQC
jgi:hypothetical protein